MSNITQKNLKWFRTFLEVTGKNHVEEGLVVLFSDRKPRFSLIGIKQTNHWWTIPVPIFMSLLNLEMTKDAEDIILSAYGFVISKQPMSTLNKVIFSFARSEEIYTPIEDGKGLYRFENARKAMNPNASRLSRQEIAEVLALHPRQSVQPPLLHHCCSAEPVCKQHMT